MRRNPTIREMARVTVAGVPLDEGSVEYRGWLVYTAAREEAQKQGDHPLLNKAAGLEGVRFQGSLHRIVTDLFPETERMDQQARTAFQRPIYGYLTGSRNAVCVFKGGTGQTPVWWLSRKWNDTHSQASPGQHDEREKVKVTPHEAGEDRPPAPVTQRYRCKACSATFQTRTEVGVHAMQFHTPMKECPDCGKSFRNLGSHRRSKHGITAKMAAAEVRGMFVCTACGREFASKNARNGHLATHAGTPDPRVGRTKTVTVVNTGPTVAATDVEPDVTALAQMMAEVLQAEVSRATEGLAARVREAEERAAAAEERLARFRRALGEIGEQ